MVEITIEEARRAKTPVLAGAGGNNTAHVIEMAREFEALGASGILSVTPVLQQADAGRAVPALQGDCRGGFAADHSLQHSGPHRREHRAGDVGPAGRDREYCGREGSVGKYFADGCDSRQGAGAISRAVGRRCDHAAADGAGRTRGDFGFVERNSGGDDADRDSSRWRTISPQRAKFTSGMSRLMEVNFVETNPGPVKAAMALMGLLEPVWRLPMVAPKPENLGENSQRARSSWAGASRRMLRAEIERLFDENPPQYSEEHTALFQTIQRRAERGRGARGGA